MQKKNKQNKLERYSEFLKVSLFAVQPKIVCRNAFEEENACHGALFTQLIGKSL
jgi:hypothetical protein